MKRLVIVFFTLIVVSVLVYFSLSLVPRYVDKTTQIDVVHTGNQKIDNEYIGYIEGKISKVESISNSDYSYVYLNDYHYYYKEAFFEKYEILNLEEKDHFKIIRVRDNRLYHINDNVDYKVTYTPCPFGLVYEREFVKVDSDFTITLDMNSTIILNVKKTNEQVGDVINFSLAYGYDTIRKSTLSEVIADNIDKNEYKSINDIIL